MKIKLTALLLALCMLLLTVTGCAQQAAPAPTAAPAAPAEPAVVEKETVILPTDMAGKLVSFIGSKLTITNEQDSNEYSFDVSQAQISAKNMIAGDEIVVFFTGDISGTDTSAVTVLQVEDLGGAPTEQEEQEVAGTLVAIGENTITIQLNDGTQLTFNSNNCEHHFKNGLQSGNWVSVTYVGELKGSDNSSVKVLSITDNDANEKIQAAKDEMSIEAKDMLVYCSSSTGVHVRQSYSVDSKQLGSLSFGEAIQCTGVCANGWYRVTYKNQEAYIYGQYLSTSVPTEDPNEVVHITGRNETVYCNNATGVHVRQSYSTSAKLLGSLSYGEAIQRTGICDNGWSQVSYKNQVAYIYSVYLSSTLVDETNTDGMHIDSLNQTMYCNNQSGVHVRASYTTKSKIVGSLSFGEAVHCTGICANNWYRVTFRGQTAYVAGNYLSSHAPSDPTPAPAPSSSQHTVSGSVVEVSRNTISFVPDGYTDVYTLNVASAEHRYANGIQTGNRITVTYTGNLNNNPHVIRVVDKDNNSAGTARYTGTVIGGTMNTITIITDDGAQLTFDKQDARSNVSGIVEGIRVRITADPSMSEPSSNILFAAVIDPA